MNVNIPEKGLPQAILASFSLRKDLVCWRQNTGSVRIGRRFVVFGHRGAADITGILRDGRRVEIECKSTIGRQSKHQKDFEKMIRRMGGVYILCRSVEEAWAKLEAAK